MDNYTKGEVLQLDDSKGLCFQLQDTDVVMTVTYGSKIRNLMGFALKKMQEPAAKKLVWTGNGPAVTKVITCAEIMKRKIKGLHQSNKLEYKRVQETWLPKIEGLEKLIVNRDIPSISILLSKDKLDTEEPGYQAPGKCSILHEEDFGQRKKNWKKFPKSEMGNTGHPYRSQQQYKCKKRWKPQSGKKCSSGGGATSAADNGNNGCSDSKAGQPAEKGSVQ